MLAITFFFLFTLPSVILSIEFRDFEQLPLPPSPPPGAVGPISDTYDLYGNSYTGISDGRILKLDKKTNNFEDFAYTAPSRSKAACDGNDDPARGPTCGRPIGVDFDWLKKVFFVTDQFFGFLRVGLNGGLATQIANSAEGIPFGQSINDIEIDPLQQIVYFAQATTTLPPMPRRRFDEILGLSALTDSTTGRIMSYNIKTGELSVVARDLKGATGVALSLDGTYIVVSEFAANRIIKIYIKGQKKGSTETILTLGGRPLFIERYGSTFWVAVRNNVTTPRPGPRPRPDMVTFSAAATKFYGFPGKAILTVDLSPFYGGMTVTQIEQKGIEIYTGSSNARFLGRFKFY